MSRTLGPQFDGSKLLRRKIYSVGNLVASNLLGPKSTWQQIYSAQNPFAENILNLIYTTIAANQSRCFGHISTLFVSIKFQIK
jgi:hypothetical protein